MKTNRHVIAVLLGVFCGTLHLANAQEQPKVQIQSARAVDIRKMDSDEIYGLSAQHSMIIGSYRNILSLYSIKLESAESTNDRSKVAEYLRVIRAINEAISQHRTLSEAYENDAFEKAMAEDAKNLKGANRKPAILPRSGR